MLDRRVEITNRGAEPETLTLKRYLMLLSNIFRGFNDFDFQPVYIDYDLQAGQFI
jgi:hypothetical protein